MLKAYKVKLEYNEEETQGAHTASTCIALLLWTEVPDIWMSATESAV